MAKPLCIQDQIINLKGKGLVFKNEKNAQRFLLNNNYYRLKAYMLPFQDNTLPDKPFINKIYFEDILDIYNFDSKLRTLIFSATGKIEIALRNQIIHRYSIAYGEQWHLDETYFKKTLVHSEFIKKLNDVITRSQEKFMIHHRIKNPSLDIDCWVSLEVISFGELSKMFENLKADRCKMNVVIHFGAQSTRILENWLYRISVIRNICAHHGCLWNRELKDIILPKKLPSPFISNITIPNNKIYSSICCILYLLNMIEPQNNFKNEFKNLLSLYPSINLKQMGFPNNWESEMFWQ
jgi:Abortive infection bacteriophage resistance protein